MLNARIGGAVLLCAVWMGQGATQSTVIARDTDQRPVPAWLSDLPERRRFAFSRPRIVQPVNPERTVRLAPGAIVASQTILLPPLELVSDTAIVIDALDVRLEAGTVFARASGGGHDWFCRIASYPTQGSAADPPRRLCLADTDGDGALDHVVSGPGPISVTPVRLHARASGEPRLPPTRILRVLKVDAIGARAATLSASIVFQPNAWRGAQFEIGLVPGHEQLRYQLELPLRAGAAASFAGVRLRVDRGPGGWWARADGDYAREVELHREGTIVDAATLYMQLPMGEVPR